MLDPFEERILDLQTVTEATTLDELEAAGRALGAAVLESAANDAA